MAQGNSNHFVCIVAGENPDILIGEYNKNKTTDKQIVYAFKDASFIRKSYIEMYEALLKKENLNEYERLVIESDLDGIKEDTDIEFFSILTQEYDHDEETGDAITYKNLNGKFQSCNLGKNFSIPFSLKNGKDAFQARKDEIDWKKMHMSSGQTEIYSTVWDLVIDRKIPQTDIEKLYYKNMKDNIPYLKSFGNKENYIESMCSFWGYAFLSEETGWVELESNMNQFEWMRKYYDRFIRNLSDNVLLSVFECKL